MKVVFRGSLTRMDANGRRCGHFRTRLGVSARDPHEKSFPSSRPLCATRTIGAQRLPSACVSHFAGVLELGCSAEYSGEGTPVDK